MNTAAQVSKVLKLHFDHGYSYGVIAYRLGMTRCRVSGIVHRHRQEAAIAPRVPGGADMGSKTTRGIQ